MFKLLRVFSIVLFLCCFALGNGFCEYYNLVGKWVELHGPSDFQTLGIALDKATCDRVIAGVKYDDQAFFTRLIKDYDIFRVQNYASAMVLDVKLFEGKAKVMVFNTAYKRESGWVPIEWLDSNQTRPTFSGYRPWAVTKYVNYDL
tara:strand:- start:16 stop:453 length:438 start_codon:yes stop_codon:yes gene_type:complete